ncbi:MAG: hypothetical protein QHJ34_13765 [bacterium]|jgi:hypothetical protein|nr:hypothetical protein [candidate division KSB1 bacterium]MDH7561278.1 hypothetical protein [bacterium]
MHIRRSGTDVNALAHLFADGKGEAFRFALGESFSFASELIRTTRRVKPNHALELWDQAVQYKLRLISRARDLFADGTSLHLEKQDSSIVWQFGFSITECRRRGKRLWTLPDGIIITPSQVIALEFDHGDSVGRWASQLLKAVRSLASDRINRLLYCFCMDKDLHSSGNLVDQQDAFTKEFLTLLDASLLGKSLGMITVFAMEWQSVNLIEIEEVSDFYKSVYITNEKASPKSRKIAHEVLHQLHKSE